MGTVNIGDLYPNGIQEIKPVEDLEDKRHRHIMELRNQTKEFFLAGAGILFIFAVFAFSIFLIYRASDETQIRLGIGLLTSVFSGGLSFIAGIGFAKKGK